MKLKVAVSFVLMMVGVQAMAVSVHPLDRSEFEVLGHAQTEWNDTKPQNNVAMMFARPFGLHGEIRVDKGSQDIDKQAELNTLFYGMWKPKSFGVQKRHRHLLFFTFMILDWGHGGHDVHDWGDVPKIGGGSKPHLGYDHGVSCEVNPVPVPASLPLFAGAVAMFAVWRRRTNKKVGSSINC